jgi:hypothetical protein
MELYLHSRIIFRQGQLYLRLVPVSITLQSRTLKMKRRRRDSVRGVQLRKWEENEEEGEKKLEV